eukprot:350233-Chlamydomonas_euryale.AAC.2
MHRPPAARTDPWHTTGAALPAAPAAAAAAAGACSPCPLRRPCGPLEYISQILLTTLSGAPLPSGPSLTL